MRLKKHVRVSLETAASREDWKNNINQHINMLSFRTQKLIKTCHCREGKNNFPFTLLSS